MLDVDEENDYVTVLYDGEQWLPEEFIAQLKDGYDHESFPMIMGYDETYESYNWIGGYEDLVEDFDE